MGLFDSLGNLVKGASKALNPLSVVGDVVGGAANVASTAMTNKANKDIMREQNQWNLQQWNREADFTREMWNANNEYNDPSMQMQRLTDAGLSPWAAASVMGAGDASMVSTPSGSAAAGAQMQAPQFDFLATATQRVFDNYLRQEMQNKELELKDEELAQAKIKTAVDTQFGLAIGQSQLNNLLYDEHNKRANAALSLQALENNSTMFQLQQDYQRRQNTLMERTIKEQELKNVAQEIINEAEQLKLDNLPKELAASLALTAAMTYRENMAGNLSKQEIENKIAEKVETEARAAGVKFANKIARKTAAYQVKTAAANAFLAENMKYGKVVGIGRGLGNYILGTFRNLNARSKDAYIKNAPNNITRW